MQPSHITNQRKVRTIDFTNNLQIGKLIFLAASNLIRQSTCLFQLDSNLLCNQVIISCLD